MRKAFYQIPANSPPHSEDSPYMTPEHVEYFRQKILRLREELAEKLRRTINGFRQKGSAESDILDRCTVESFRDMELSACQRYRELLARNEAALERIEAGCFGYCEVTGLEIGLKRLEVIPYATLCVQAQELIERRG